MIYLWRSEGNTINDNDVADNSQGVVFESSLKSSSASGNRFCRNNDHAVMNKVAGTQVPASGCWWGAPDGPGLVGPGSRDKVSAGVDYSGFLTTWPEGLCAN